MLSGLQPSTLNIVGARPSMGNTAFGLGMATHVAKHTGRPVLVFSLEMGHVELTQRILASEAEVDSQKIRNGGSPRRTGRRSAGRSAASRCRCSSTTTRASP